jgi:hypothetical protein
MKSWGSRGDRHEATKFVDHLVVGGVGSEGSTATHQDTEIETGPCRRRASNPVSGTLINRPGRSSEDALRVSTGAVGRKPIAGAEARRGSASRSSVSSRRSTAGCWTTGVGSNTVSPIVATGIRFDGHEIEGLKDTYGKSGLTANDRFDPVPYGRCACASSREARRFGSSRPCRSNPAAMHTFPVSRTRAPASARSTTLALSFPTRMLGVSLGSRPSRPLSPFEEQTAKIGRHQQSRDGATYRAQHHDPDAEKQAMFPRWS